MCEQRRKTNCRQEQIGKSLVGFQYSKRVSSECGGNERNCCFPRYEADSIKGRIEFVCNLCLIRGRQREFRRFECWVYVGPRHYMQPRGAYGRDLILLKRSCNVRPWTTSQSVLSTRRFLTLVTVRCMWPSSVSKPQDRYSYLMILARLQSPSLMF
jgi:hypothetical protein